MYKAKNYINGKWHSVQDGELLTIKNPADHNEIVGQAEFADKQAIESAVSSAVSALPRWQAMTFSQKAAFIRRLLDEITRFKSELSRIITLENGKTLKESVAEIDSAIAEAGYQAAFLENNLSEKVAANEIRYAPLGVVMLITPWNFPLATVIRKLIPALLCGNTAIVKPSELTPVTSAMLFDMIDKTEIPRGTVNLILGKGPQVVPHLLSTGSINAVSLTGSDSTGKHIAKYIAERNIRFQAEMGGSNAVVILNDADLESAVSGITTNGFCCAGQWCTGTTRVIIEDNVYTKTMQMLKDKAGQLIVGPGMDEKTDMGPLISAEAQDRLKKTVETALAEGAVLHYGGSQLSSAAYPGHFFPPTILGEVKPSMKVARQEVFGPLLTLFKARDFNDAVALLNNSSLGLSCSIYTKDAVLADNFLNVAQAGLCHVNLPTGFRDYALPLSGWKDSGRGIPESGRFMRDFFTQTKAIYRN